MAGGEAVSLGKHIARQGGLSEVAVEMIFNGSQFLVVELNFGHDELGALDCGQERLKAVMEMIERGEL